MRDFVPLLDPAGLKRLSDQIVEVASRRRDLAVLANGWWAGAWAALERADRSDWDACVAEYDKVSADLSLAVELSSAASMRCVTAQIEGQLEEARRYAEEAVTHARSIDDPTAEILYLARVVLLGLDAGEARELLEAMTALAGDYANVSTFQAGLCLTAAFAGEFGLAKRLLSEQSVSGFGNVNADVEGLAVAAFYAHAAAIVEDRSSAEVLLSLLETVKPRAVRVGALDRLVGTCRLPHRRAAPAPRTVRRSKATFGELSGDRFADAI